jgi:nucleoside-diphosphate-sugar epimerase
MAKLLVYGAGPLGSLFAARLQEGGNDVSILARTTSVPTPNIDGLYPYFDADVPLMHDGRAEIPLNWGGMFAGLGALLGLVLAARLLRSRPR